MKKAPFGRCCRRGLAHERLARGQRACKINQPDLLFSYLRRAVFHRKCLRSNGVDAELRLAGDLTSVTAACLAHFALGVVRASKRS